MPNVTYITTIPLEENVYCCFQYQNCRVSTSSDLKPLGVDKVEDDIIGYFIISIDTSVKDFESVTDAAAHARPMFLIILDILSLFLDRPMTPFDTGYQTSFVTIKEEKAKRIDTTFVIGEEDISNSLTNFLRQLNEVDSNKQKFFYSLMDRWRKAVYMQNVSEDSQEYDDEAVIAYFHVLELLAEEHSRELGLLIKEKIENSLIDIYGGIMQFEGNYLHSLIASKKQLNNQLILSDLPVAGKILYALGKLGVMSKRLKYFIGNWIKDRNNVAHGRRVYQDRIIFPVPPFFPNARINDYTLNTLRYLTAHVICVATAGIDIHEERWEEEHNMLIPTPEEIKSFVSDNRHKELTNEQFVNGNLYNINPGSISWYLVDKKIKHQEGISVLRDFLMNIDLNDSDQVNQIVIAAVILADFVDEELRAICEQVIVEAYKNRWHPFINLRELLSFLEYNNHTPKFLENMIIDKKVR